ncbi:hypothetical protein GGF32_003809 [Allomyces javanicus]|nr:hypothetical protein GGF32_003809 [Allomyces javanicus]
MDTTKWGPPTWDTLFFVAYGFDLNPAPKADKIKQYKAFFKALGNVLPCAYCRQSYAKFLGELDMDKYVHKKHGLFEFVYHLRNKVNSKLCRQETEALQDAWQHHSATVDAKSPQFWPAFRDIAQDIVFTKPAPSLKEALAKYARYEIHPARTPRKSRTRSRARSK